jgi:hypothetical protein
LWDVTTGKVRETVEVNEVVESVAFSPDGQTLAAGCRGNRKIPVKDDTITGEAEETTDGPVKLFERKKDSAETK